MVWRFRPLNLKIASASKDSTWLAHSKCKLSLILGFSWWLNRKIITKILKKKHMYINKSEKNKILSYLLNLNCLHFRLSREVEFIINWLIFLMLENRSWDLEIGEVEIKSIFILHCEVIWIILIINLILLII